MSDIIEIEILDDGTIKSSTNKISMPNHAKAEMFLRDVAKLAGGKTLRESKHKNVFTVQHQNNELNHSH